MIHEEFALTVDRIVLDGIELPADAVASFPALVAAELQQILDGGLPVPGGVSGDSRELRPLILSLPPDVPALARALAERIAAAAAAEGAWDE